MLFSLFANIAGSRPAKTAIHFDDQDISYSQLYAAALSFSERLTALQVESGDRVVLLLPNQPGFVAGFLAIAKLGAVAVPINSLFQESELKFYFSNCQPRAVITTSELRPLCDSLIKSLVLKCHVVVSDGVDTFTGACNIDVPGTKTGVEHSGEVLIQYSSGSTGTPKTIRRTQENLIAEAESLLSTTGIDDSDRILTVVPLFHAHGFGNCLMAVIASGATMVLLEIFNRKSVLDALKEGGVSVFPGVPFMFKMLASSPAIERDDFPSLKLVFSAGAPLDQDTAQRFPQKFGVSLRQLYGSTETGAIAINLGDCDGDLWACVGPPLDGVELKIVDESGVACPVGVVGELLVRSPAMTLGYENAESAGKQSFRDGFFWSGDLGRYDDAGNIYISGRKTLFINVSGNKVDPAEVERVLAEHSSVSEVVVVGVTDKGGKELVKAVVVSSGNTSTAELQAWCQSRLVDYKIPRIIEFREEIPKSALGKVLRKYLENAM